ncbi:Nn.00g022940.m01.CDS01 [Neocucurbitaria sp. VM-36]
MATQQPQIDEQTVAPSVDTRHASLASSLVAPKSDMIASEACVITPDDIEKKPEKIRESERQAWFQNAVNERLNNPTGYQKVAVLVVRWHDEIDGFSKGHNEEIKKLKNLFSDRFRYEYKEVKLETKKKPQNTLNLAIMQHIEEHDGPNNLLIVYYTGHGRLEGPPGGEQRLELSATASARITQKDRYPATAFWHDAESPLLNSAEADVLAILDCCFASHAQKGYVDDRRTYELLAASPMNQTTRAPGPESFTTALTKSLKGLLAEYKNHNFTTIKLCEKMNMHRNPPSMLWDRLHKHERHVQLAPLEKN